MKPKMEVDFTQNKDEVRKRSITCIFGLSESNVYDALPTVDRLKDVPGKKSILLVATGRDTFSKQHYDQTMKALHQTDVPIFIVGMSKSLPIRRRCVVITEAKLIFLQDENQMKTFAKRTGGFAGSRNSPAKSPGFFGKSRRSCGTSTASLIARPIASRRKIPQVKIDLVAPDGSPSRSWIKREEAEIPRICARRVRSPPKGVARSGNGLLGLNIPGKIHSVGEFFSAKHSSSNFKNSSVSRRI